MPLTKTLSPVDGAISDDLSRPRKTRRRRGKLFGLRAALSNRAYFTIAGASFLVIVALWCALSLSGRVSKIFLPSPVAVWEAAVRLYQSGQLWEDVWWSNVRVWAGFTAAAVLSVPLGMLAGTFRPFEALLEPILGFFRYMPVPAFIPLLMLYTGIGEEPKILIIFIGAIVQMIIMVADVTRQTPQELMDVAQTLGCGRMGVFRRVIWRNSLPGIWDLLRVNLGWAWTYLVVAELVAANVGLGYRILKAQRFLQTDVIFLYLLLIGFLGVASDLAFKLAGKKMFPWATR
jgi:NitT/TauT family transport system permease protein